MKIMLMLMIKENKKAQNKRQCEINELQPKINKNLSIRNKKIYFI